MTQYNKQNWSDGPGGGTPLSAARLNKMEDGIAAAAVADPVLSDFVYDGSGNLTSYAEDGITITLTYNADGTVATQQRGTGPVRAFTYSGGNLAGVA